MDIIQSKEHLNNVIESRPDAENKAKRMQFDHAAIASQTIKLINSMRIDPFVKKVVTLRLLGPCTTGRERSHISIAMELGVRVHDVVQAEDYGKAAMLAFMNSTDLQEAVERYNRDDAVNNAVKEMGNSSRN
jgi:hypothetical protein